MTNSDDFEEFMRNYQNMVYSTATRLLGNETDATDIAQEVFLKAYERFDQLRTSPTAGGWLKTVTTNLCLNHLSRYRARWRFFSEMTAPESDEDYVANVPAADTHTQSVDDADRQFILEEGLKKLPDDQRVPLVLYHFEDMSYEEIARRTGKSLSKVKTDIHRGREALRRKLIAGQAERETKQMLGPDRTGEARAKGR